MTGRCPACAEAGEDRTGNHLVIMPDGRFGCVLYPGPEGRAHRRRIHALIGAPDERTGKPVKLTWPVSVMGRKASQ